MWVTACSDVAFNPTGSSLEHLQIPQGYQKDSFLFNDDPSGAKVDVLFVVDNSPSMLEEQQKLGSALSSFISSIRRLDWQIGITTTDVTTGPFGVRGGLLSMKGTNAKVLNRYVRDYETVFKNTVYRDEVNGCGNICPSGDERPLEAVRMAIDKRNSENAGFFRPDSDLVIIVLSDEDEGSDGAGALPSGTLIEHFKNAFGQEKRLTGFGIVVRPGDLNCYNSQEATGGHYGYSVSNFAGLTGGVTGSICDADYGDALESIGKRVRQVSSTITLSNLPMPETINLVMDPFDPDISWEIKGQTIRFNKMPKKGTRVDIVYMPTQQR